MKRSILTMLALIAGITLYSQVGINNDGSLPDPSAMLDIKSDTAGVLIPRMTAIQRNAINNPAQGLLVYVTDDNRFYYFNGTAWQAVGNGNPSLWNLTGTTVSPDSLYSVAIGTTATNGTFEVSTEVASGSYSGDQCTGGIATAQEYQVPYAPGNLFDDNNFSIWRNNNNLPVWIQYDFSTGNGKKIEKYRLLWSGTQLEMTPYSWELLGSNDGATWTTLDSRTGENNWVSGEWREYTFTNTQSYQIYRLNITDNNGAGSTAVYLNEMEMMEAVYSSFPALFVNGGNVGIGTQSPAANLEVDGTFRYVDGNESAGKILSSDASGNANWETAESLGIGQSFYKAGTTQPPSSINDSIYTLGSVAIGKTTAAYPLEVESTTSPRGMSVVLTQNGTGTVTGAYHSLTNTGDAVQYGVDNRISGSSGGDQYGVANTIDNTGTGMHFGVLNTLSGPNTGDHFGVYNNLTGTGQGKQYGIRNEIFNGNDNMQYGQYSAIYGNGDGAHYGTYNRLFGSGNGDQYGTYDSIYNSGNGKHYGAYHTLTGNGTGEHVGSYVSLSGLGGDNYGTKTYVRSTGWTMPYGHYTEVSGDGVGPHTGQYLKLSGTLGTQIGSHIEIENTGDSYHYGNYISLSGPGSGDHFAVYNTLTGSGNGFQIAVNNHIDNSGTGAHYGSYNFLEGSGSGNKFGTYNRISPLAGGTHYAVYGEAQKTGSYAGYFNGEVSTTQDYNYVTPKTYNWKASAVNFNLINRDDLDVTYVYEASVGRLYTYAVTNSFVFSYITFSHPVQLPQGAQITKITVYGYVYDDANLSSSVNLYRKNFSILDGENMVSVSLPVNGDYAEETTITGSSIDNNSYVYYLIFNTSWHGENMNNEGSRLFGVNIEYTIDKVSQ
ncbi:MAG: hypothetical protein Kow00127_20310 [Bacteroidales bacterium]